MLILLAATPIFSHSADRTSCPSTQGHKSNILVNARLYDGPIAENVELAPDNERGATWDVSGYKNSDRTLYLVCEYKDGGWLIFPVAPSANRCYVKGRKTTAAWCEK